MTPRRLSIPLAVLMVLTCASIAFFIFFGRDFPPTMAVRFNASGEPVVWMDRVKFIVLASFLSFMLPTFVAAAVGVLPRVFPVSFLNLPNKAYWLAPERQNAALDALMWLGLWLGSLIQAFLIAVNVGLARANALTPPVTDGVWFTAAVAAFFVGLVLWGVSLRRAFALPPSC
ncbi:MAG: hypothetical protein EPO35_02600 [Acidobacteria bacterium]|nr:MAG: hypothetical protein EPO35_02600 [Acidobacteriota bacterium]